MTDLQKHMTKEISAEQKYHIGLIRAGMIGSLFQFPQEDAFLFPFIDYLSLFFQSRPGRAPLVFLLWQGELCRFSSFGDFYFASKYHLTKERLKRPKKALRISESDDVWLSIHQVRKLDYFEEKYSSYAPLPEGTIKQAEILKLDQPAMQAAELLLHGEDRSFGARLDEVEAFFPLLIESIKYRDRSPYPEELTRPAIPDIDYAVDVLPRLESFRSVLDDVFSDAMLSQGKQFPQHEPDLGNVFCAIRVVSSGRLRYGYFPYTAGLLLSKKQREILGKWCFEKNDFACSVGLPKGESCARLLESPLGLNSRSVADAVFCSGVIDFAREADDKLWDTAHRNDEKDNLRIKAERCIYPAKKDASLYYVPIHVSGIPWLSVFTFTPRNYQHRWLHNYTFYRDIISRSAALLKEKSKSEYLSQLSEAAVSLLLNWQETPKNISMEINRRWSILARIFPFPIFQISSSGSDKRSMPALIEEIKVPGRGECYISANYTNSLLSKIADFQEITPCNIYCF
jgi:hypothetical protein